MYGRRPTISTLHGMVAAAHPLAAQAGARLLSSGGNAFDAAAATAAALNVVEPYMSSLGGMGLATCYIASEKRVRTLDFVTRVPSKFPVDKLKQREELARGAIAVGTPGNLMGWGELVKSHGKRPWKDALEPATRLARDGFPLIEFNVAEINEAVSELKKHPALYANWAPIFLGSRSRVRQGDVLKQPELAKTFAALAEHGTDHLYKGPIGRAIVEHLAKLGGTLTMADLEQAKPEWRDAIKVAYRGREVHTLSPPCEGFQCLLTLRILDGFDLGKLKQNGTDHLDTVYRAIRLAAGVRIEANVPTAAEIAAIFSDKSVEALRARLRDGKPISGPTEQWMEAPAGEDPAHTTSFSIADRDGNLVCVTQSVGSVFGSGVVVPGTGITLNNFLYWTDVNPKSPNRTRPGAPISMCMSPTITLEKGKPVLALGTPGSYGILQTQVQAMVQYFDFGLALQEAIEEPRARLWDGRRIEAEGRISGRVLDELKTRGHDIAAIEPWTMRVGGMQAVAVDPATGAMTGAADPRRDSYVATA